VPQAAYSHRTWYDVSMDKVQYLIDDITSSASSSSTVSSAMSSLCAVCPTAMTDTIALLVESEARARLTHMTIVMGSDLSSLRRKATGQGMASNGDVSALLEAAREYCLADLSGDETTRERCERDIAQMVETVGPEVYGLAIAYSFEMAKLEMSNRRIETIKKRIMGRLPIPPLDQPT